MWLTTARRLSTYNIDDSIATSTASSYYCRCAQQLRSVSTETSVSEWLICSRESFTFHTFEPFNRLIFLHCIDLRCCWMQLYIDAQYTDLKMPVDILIGTVPLRESFRNPPAPQLQSVITSQPPSAPPIYQPDADIFDIRMLAYLLSPHFYAYDRIQYDSVYLTCSKKLTASQLSLPHGINNKLKCETKNKMMSVIGPVQSRYREAVQ